MLSKITDLEKQNNIQQCVESLKLPLAFVNVKNPWASRFSSLLQTRTSFWLIFCMWNDKFTLACSVQNVSCPKTPPGLKLIRRDGVL